VEALLCLELIRAVAAAHPEWQIAMLGPVVKIDRALLPRQTSITLASRAMTIFPLPERLGCLPASICAQQRKALH
jgi:hypothetical protein